MNIIPKYYNLSKKAYITILLVCEKYDLINFLIFNINLIWFE